MKEIIENMPRIELALLIIGVFAFILGIIFGYAMIHEYRMYLEEHRKARITFRDFFKQEQFYILSISGIDIHHVVKPPVFPGVSFGNKQTNINNSNYSAVCA